MQGWGRAPPPPLTTDRVAMARSELPGSCRLLTSSGTDHDVSTWSTEPILGDSSTVFQRDMLANLENSPVGEKCIEEPVPGRRNQPSWLWLEIQVALGVGLHRSELLSTSDLLLLFSQVEFQEQGLLLSPQEGNTNHRQEVNALKTAEEQFLWSLSSLVFV